MNLKKDMIALDHGNHDKWTNVQHFCSVFDHANLASSFPCSKYLPELYSGMCIFSNMDT